DVLSQLEITDSKIVYNDIAPQNWNADWEASFQPVTIESSIYIRAPFHEAVPNIQYDLVIQPKMSFGTGHHDTTASVMEMMLKLNFNNKTVFDYGCGTGILSVLASKMGAKSIFANDIDDWAFENVAENLELNHIENVDYKQGDISLVNEHIYDIILANINRNVLLDSMENMSKLLNSGGQLLMSGFYIEDIEIINEAAVNYGLKQLSKQSTDRNWTVMLYEKQ
ncbi:MAG: 50S ribosomal protein L11 methyltransferase, partial [Bacteroidetes bacterium]|nr:50S ribosomal protein L11 methyltransferase [Bacteroidota bacterium]